MMRAIELGDGRQVVDHAGDLPARQHARVEPALDEPGPQQHRRVRGQHDLRPLQVGLAASSRGLRCTMPRHDVPDIFLNATALRSARGQRRDRVRRARARRRTRCAARGAARRRCAWSRPCRRRCARGSTASPRRARCSRCVSRKRVPIATPAAPYASAATRPRPSKNPPAAITGMSTASTTCGSSSVVATAPVWPPPSPPCTITASTPHAATFSAWRRAPIDGTTRDARVLQLS